jgi:DNA repair exonuclease SbcCD ATPase subunit
MVKTEREDDGNSSMAKMLMDIKEQLTTLARKKKDIAGYDHQIELIRVLSDKVGSFMELYKERSALTGMLADICVTGAEFAKNDQAQMDNLTKKRDEKRAQKEAQKKYLDCLKVARDKNRVSELKAEEETLTENLNAAKQRLAALTEDYNLKESINEYLDYLSDRAKFYQYDEVIKNMMSASSFDEEQLYTYAYNIKMRTDLQLKDIRENIERITAELTQTRLKKEYQERLLTEATTSLAVAESKKKAADEEIVNLSERMSKLRMSMNDIQFVNYDSQLESNEALLEELKKAIAGIEEEFRDNEQALNDKRLELRFAGESLKKLDADIESRRSDMDRYREASGKLDNIRKVYNTDDAGGLLEVISRKITMTIMDIYGLEQEIAAAKKRSERLAEGRIIETSEAVKKVLDYIETRHGNLAMTGMDYIMAIPRESKKKLLETNPELVYGVVVDDYDSIKDDPNIRSVNTGEQMVFVYDMQSVNEKAMHMGEHVFTVGARPEYIVDEETADKLIRANDESTNELLMKKEVKSEMLAALREDETFVIRVMESGIMESESELERVLENREKLSQEMSALEAAMKDIRSRMEKLALERDGKNDIYNRTLEDKNRLITVASLAELIDRQEKASEKAAEDIKRLQDNVNRLTNEAADENVDVTESEARLALLKETEEKLVREWEENYKNYYNIDREYEVLGSSDDEIKARFKAMVEAGSDDARAIEDKRELMNTISISMERSLKNIERRGTSINKLKAMEKENRLFAANDDVLYAAKQSMDKAAGQIKECENSIKDIRSKISKLEGSMEYAIKRIREEYGEYSEVEASLSEIVSNLEDGEALLARLEAEYKACEQEYREYFRQQGYMIDLYKDVKRIVVTNDISLEKAVPLLESKDRLRDMFEDALLKFDKSTKQLERAKNELLKFKGNTASALEQMEVYELAVTIRDDVVIPENYEMAKELLDNLSQTIDYIKLERDRVEKSLADMETIKSNFEEQCLQRCLDVKTELDKLPKLSRIIVDGEPVQMVGLTIPYVKDEFLRQRMSDYIDRIVAQADDYDKDNDRMKFIRSSLALKKLFGVIVTDMNGIKLSLYKRERIREQSRYLRYEEAVGSTGQSQGIYIQFLVAVINYISGMYQTDSETVRTKTVFIDNPFGAAKDVYIWEPIFAMLKANRVQLIVPARGATPAITGRFDVNYILGQQMSGGKQLTVVTDYTSQVDQEELEYQELTYEQGTFDFV